MKTSPARTVRALAAGLIAGSLALGALTGCSSESTPANTSGGAAAPLAEAKFQLGWIPNDESMAPIYAASAGYFEKQGTKVTIAPGGPEVTVDAQIVSGNVLMGTLSSEGLANSIGAGAPLVAIGAIYQTSSSAIVTLESSGIKTPKDLEGKRFGVSQTDAKVYTPFFKLAGVDESKITKVQTGSDAAPLISGEVDAMSGTLANQPVAIAAKGIPTRTIRLADYGYNRWSQLLVVRKDSLADPQKRATVAGMLKAITQAATETVADPTKGATAVVNMYGAQLGLDLGQQTAAAKIWAELAKGSKEHGPVFVTPEGIAEQQKFFDTIGLKADAKAMFDLSLQGQS